MTEKLKVSREVADAIECVKRECYGFDNAMNIHIKNGWTSEEKMPLSQITAEQLATALIVGYEIEMTPHEYVTKHYNIAKRNRKESLEKGDRESAMLNRGVMVGIKRTLRALKVTVEGVNDNDNNS